ncbi:MAG: glycoside hydrolase family 15 protein [bacterium]|nr:glycoside hydrolase family 15 protein [bacterium]
MSDRPIADYALLSDCHSAALVSRQGSIDWLCFPRFDSPSVFARLLDVDGGHWSVTVPEANRVTRRYLDGTMILETVHEAPGGSVRVTDGMAVGPDEQGHQLGTRSPGLVLRRVECVSGTATVELEFAPRPEYGLVEPLLAPVPGGLVARGGASILTLSCPHPFEMDGAIARRTVRLSAGDQFCLSLEHRTSEQGAADATHDAAVAERLEDTIRGWRTWSDLHQAYVGPWRELVRHSGRVLQALTFQPTGAIVAAPTTSLPEAAGGERNWDYRFTWVRDASLTLEALWVAACPDEADRFFSWMAAAAAGRVIDQDLQIMFGVGGEHDLTERELPHLGGWKGSRPVRIGNGAWTQRQIDVYGELLSAARRLREQLGRFDAATRAFLVDVADMAGSRWKEPDQGIWEVRDAPRHYLYSKLMCWVALDCAADLAAELGAEERRPAWIRMRDEIRDAILGDGWSDEAQAFTQSFGSTDLDASALMLPIVGFLPGDDERVKATVEAIAGRLTDDRGLVYRYRSHDGLEGEEGTFLICTFWLAQAQAMAGDLDGARTTFESAISYANDVGLLSEEVDPTGAELLGNYPQAFSHIGLVNAAWAIHQAEQGEGSS